jgi:hypothetical protein
LPFRAIGTAVRGRAGHEVTGVEIDPVKFEPGGAVIQAEARKHVQRVADFLRASPYVGLVIEPMITGEDLAALKAKAMALQVQRLQREPGLTFEAVAEGAVPPPLS